MLRFQRKTRSSVRISYHTHFSIPPTAAEKHIRKSFESQRQFYCHFVTKQWDSTLSQSQTKDVPKLTEARSKKGDNFTRNWLSHVFVDLALGSGGGKNIHFWKDLFPELH